MTPPNIRWDQLKFTHTLEKYVGPPALNMRWEDSLQQLRNLPLADPKQPLASSPQEGDSSPTGSRPWAFPLWFQFSPTLPQKPLVWPNFPSKGNQE